MEIRINLLVGHTFSDSVRHYRFDFRVVQVIYSRLLKTLGKAHCMRGMGLLEFHGNGHSEWFLLIVINKNSLPLLSCNTKLQI